MTTEHTEANLLLLSHVKHDNRTYRS